MKPVKNNKLLKLFGALVLQAVVMAPQAFALPTLQAHLLNSVAADNTLQAGATTYSDQDTWTRASGPGKPVGLELIGAFKNGTQAIDHGYLVVTVPDPQPTVLGSKPLTLWFENPITHAYGILDLSTYTDGYQNKYLFEQIGDHNANYWFQNYLAGNSGLTFTGNNHDPYGKPAVEVYAISLDFLMNGLGTFHPYSDAQRPYLMEDCNATNAGTTGCTQTPGKSGEIKTLNFGFQGVDWAHIDLVAQKKDQNGNRSWDISPGTHDSTWQVPQPSTLALTAQVPEPGTLALTAIGLTGLLVRRRRLV